MNNERKGRDIFYGVIAVATLIIAAIGATLAYFSVTATSNEGAVNASAKVVSIEYDDSKQVTAQADKLIPATLAVVQSSYLDSQANFDEDDPSPSNVCLDAKGQQVCSVYRFSMTGDIDVVAMLNNEYNGFTNLRYAVYDVTAGNLLVGKEAKMGGFMNLNNENVQSLPLTKCDNASEDNKCSTTVSEVKTYATNAINSIFGTTGSGASLTTASVRLTTTPKTYDLVLFLNDLNSDQTSLEAGASYQGTIEVSIANGENIIRGSITP